MRTPIVFAVSVSVFTGIFATHSFAENPDAAQAEWTTVYEAGLAASQRHSDEEALGLFERNWQTSRNSVEEGSSAAALGQTYRRLHRINEAKEWLERALHAFRTDPRHAWRLAYTASDLADLYRTTGDYGAAERLLRDVLVSPSFDADSKTLLRNNLADLLREEGRSAEALPLFKESLDLSPASWRLRVYALIGLADIDRGHRDWKSGIDRWNEVLGICRRERDEKTEAIALRGLGLTWLDSGDAARAEPLLRRSLRIMENNADMQSEEVAGAHSALAALYRSENKLALAEGEWSRALQIDRSVLGEAHPQVAILMEMLSEVYSVRGEIGLAREFAARAAETMSGSFGQNSMPVATALTYQADVEQRAGDPAAAAKDYERAIRIARFHPEQRSVEAAIIRNYAGLLKATHRSREADALLAFRSSEPQP